MKIYRLNETLRLFLILGFYIAFTNDAISQIVVVEAKQLTDTTHGFYGNAEMNFNFTSNTVNTLSGGTGSEIFYAWKKNKVISLNRYNVILNVRETENAPVNQGYQHLRFTHDFNYRFTGAIFAQIQTNRVLRIRQRTLIGLGPRFNVQPFGKNSLLFGIKVMYEYEDELNSSITHHDIRASFYLYYKIQLGESARVSSVTYYQPRVDLIKDFRMSNTIDLSVQITKKINWVFTTNILFDAFPVVDPDIPDLTYTIINGFRFSF